MYRRLAQRIVLHVIAPCLSGLLGRPKWALAFYEIVLQKDPECSTAWLRKGRLLNEIGRRQQGLECVETALLLKPDNIGMWTWKAHILTEMGRLVDAISAYRRAEQLGDTYVEVLVKKIEDNLRGKTASTAPTMDQEVRQDDKI